LPHGQRGDGCNVTGTAAVEIDSVDIEIKEQFVLDNRSAERSAVVVVAQERLGLGGAGKVITVSLQLVALEIFIACTVPLVAAAFGDLVENRSTDPVLRREGRGADLQLLHSLKGSDVNVGANGQIGGGAVLEEVVIKRQVAIHRDSNSGVAGVARSRGHASTGTGGTGEQLRQGTPVLTIRTYLREVHHGLRVKGCGLFGALGLQQRDVGRNFNHLS